jgi:hypothetical protein
MDFDIEKGLNGTDNEGSAQKEFKICSSTTFRHVRDTLRDLDKTVSVVSDVSKGSEGAVSHTIEAARGTE